MQTSHRVVVGDSRSLETVANESVELVVTSPPYPMIEMWDELFVELDPAIGDALDDGAGQRAFESMHAQLSTVWNEIERVLVDGGIACINVGDATRSVDGHFRVYQNHSRIIDTFDDLGFEPLPEILWRKPVNSATKFMGSGMLPPNAYVTLEHEYILVFRKGTTQRSFEPKSARRYKSAYFWEERNRWFSDVWTDVTGEQQTTTDPELRDRSGAYPFDIPYRLINMYSVYGDTILDPFWGTGTTSLAAIVAGRNSIGYELDGTFRSGFEQRLTDIQNTSRAVVRDRLCTHFDFVEQGLADGRDFTYDHDHYGFPVTTKQEQSLTFFLVTDVDGPTSPDQSTAAHEESVVTYRASYNPLETIDDVTSLCDTEVSEQSVTGSDPHNTSLDNYR